MLTALEAATRKPGAFRDFATSYDSFISVARTEVQNSTYFGRLTDLHAELSEQQTLGIRGIEAWSNGETAFRLVTKSWESVVDKLYRFNIEDNGYFSRPPRVPTIYDQVDGVTPEGMRWITPEITHEVADDLLRTKFVVPFVDDVVAVSDKVAAAIEDCALPYYRRFHAKDSGYHAQHYYALLRVPGYLSGTDTTVVLEVKVLTKMQDTLGELTHLLYEKHRRGQIPQEKKRKFAWQRHDSDFLAAYLGHAGHFLEASIADLKDQVVALEKEA